MWYVCDALRISALVRKCKRFENMEPIQRKITVCPCLATQLGNQLLLFDEKLSNNIAFCFQTEKTHSELIMWYVFNLSTQIRIFTFKLKMSCSCYHGTTWTFFWLNYPHFRMLKTTDRWVWHSVTYTSQWQMLQWKWPQEKQFGVLV